MDEMADAEAGDRVSASQGHAPADTPGTSTLAEMPAPRSAEETEMTEMTEETEMTQTRSLKTGGAR